MIPDRSTRLAYGFGAIAFGAKLQLLNLLLLFYNQILGLPAAAVSAVLAASVMLDAIWDPLLGYLSDHTRSRLGRRHPYLYGVAVPLAVAFALLWRPPAGLSQTELLVWLAVFAIAVRLLISMYEIPNQALLPELTRDYDVRTNLVSYRFFFLAIGATLAISLSFGVFLRSSPEHPFGQLNQAGYAPLGLAVAAIMLVAILVSALGTHRQIPKLAAAPALTSGLGPTLRGIAHTLANRNFVVIAISGLLYGVNRGIHDGLQPYLGTYFWGLASEKLLWLNLATLPASFAAALVAPGLARRWGKRQACIALFLAAIVLGNLIFLAALLHLMPPPGSTAQFVILLADRLVVVTLAIAGFIIVSSMIADIVEENEVRTGKRSEGLLVAADTFLQKLVGGVALILPGILLELVAFPAKANPATLDPQIMRNLVLIIVPLTFVITLLSTGILAYYRIDRRAHESNLAKLVPQPAPGE